MNIRDSLKLLGALFAIVATGCGDTGQSVEDQGAGDSGPANAARAQPGGPVPSPERAARADAVEAARTRLFTVREVADPAMQAGGQPGAGPAEALHSSDDTAIATGASSDPATFTVDASGQRVFLPGSGWKTVEEFWEIYYERPDLLPGDIDHQALMSIRPDGG
jgi:hypothetical protein